MAHDHHHNPNHPKHLAHHFDSMTQQFESGKLGMWLFLATEILMFGGLFVAYTIYRSNNPDVYMFAHQALDTKWGAINTVVLLLSSFTVAWAVRAAQLSQPRLLVALLALTFVGGGLFMVIKTVEYNGKYAHDLWLGPANAFYYDTKLTNEETGKLQAGLDYIAKHGSHDASKSHHGPADLHAPATPDAHPPQPQHQAVMESQRQDQAIVGEPAAPTDDHDHADAAHPTPAPVTFIADRSTIALAAVGPLGVAPAAIEDPFNVGRPAHVYPRFEELRPIDQKRTHIFFQIYYMMTGLHGIHVLVGMGVLFWLLYRAGDTLSRAWIIPFGLIVVGAYFLFLGFHVGPDWAKIAGGVLVAGSLLWYPLRRSKARHAAAEQGEFNANYFTPVEIGGLYWHLVDLIWIFLFPLLYLIR